MLPSPPASATAAPDMPAKMTLAPTFTWPSPPCIQPTVARAKLKMRVVMPAVFIKWPARMKNGTAISGKELMPFTMLCEHDHRRHAVWSATKTSEAKPERDGDRHADDHQREEQREHEEESTSGGAASP